MALAPGVRLGPYEIVSALGAGGMGADSRRNRVTLVGGLHSMFVCQGRLARREADFRRVLPSRLIWERHC